MSDAEANTLTLTVNAAVTNVGARPVFYLKRARVAEAMAARTISDLRAGKYDTRFEATVYFTDSRPPAPSEFQDILPGKSFEFELDVTLPALRPGASVPGFLSPGVYWLQVRLVPLDLSRTAKKQLLTQLGSRGVLWAEPQLTEPMQFTVVADDALRCR
jgi:hypothetical protein